MKTFRLFAVIAALFSIVLVGCGGDDEGSGESASGTSSAATTTAAATACNAPQELVDAAQEEGELVWYNSQSPDKAQEVIDAFEEKYDISVESLRLSGSQLSRRFLAETQSGGGPDAINVADPAFFEQAAKEGSLMELTPENVPSVADYPKDAIVNDRTTALIGITPWQVIYNTELTEEPPQTWEDVLKPEFKDQIVFPDPRVIPTVLGMTQVWYQELGPEFLEKFGAQNPTIVESAVPGIQFLGSGEKKILVATEEGVATPLIEEGAPIDTVLITPINGTQMYMGISESAPHPNAARLLMNWVLCEDGQSEINSPDRTSPMEGVPNTAPLPDGYVNVDLAEAEANSQEIFDLLGLN